MSRRTFFRYFSSKSSVLWGEFDAEVEAIRAALAAVPATVPMMDAIRQAVVAANHYRAEDVPELRARMNLIICAPALQASAAVRYDAWERAISDFAATRIGQPRLPLPTRRRPGHPGRLPRRLRPLVRPRGRRPHRVPGCRRGRARRGLPASIPGYRGTSGNRARPFNVSAARGRSARGGTVEVDTAQLMEAIEDDIEETSRLRNHRLCLLATLARRQMPDPS